MSGFLRRSRITSNESLLSDKRSKRNGTRSLSPNRSGGKSKVKFENEWPVGVEAVVNMSLTGLGGFADLACVPGLQGIASLLQTIAKLCFNVKRNRNAAQQLTRECEAYYSSIEAVCKGKRLEENVAKSVQKFEELLQTIMKSMDEWSKLGFLNSFVYQLRISESIKSYGNELRSIRENIQFMSTLVMISEKADYEEAILKDKHDMVVEFSRRENADMIREGAVRAKREGGGEEITEVLGRIVKDIDLASLGKAERTQLEQNLCIMSKAAGQLTYIPFDHLEFDSDQPILGSNLYDIYSGKLGGEVVAIKKARHSPDIHRSVEHILKEANNWKSACESDPGEDYILKLIGVSFPQMSFVMISRLMANRDLMSYISKQENVSVDRMKLARRIAKGLAILHGRSPPIAHGHLRGSNIIINDNGNPLLGDFGLSKSLKDMNGQPMTMINGIDSSRWFAPEILDGDALISTRSDVYSFAMTVFELMTGKRPFDHVKNPFLIPGMVKAGQRPERPTELAAKIRGLDDNVWELLTRCWAHDPFERPTIFEVDRELESYTAYES
ncbi:kinase-like protein [Schizopora paradoxa]|uniref:Kinase-like protein n=1 Tax=Schizopora paradoxa TaxID=27342 RepID=A0A0H2RGN9_9AGAM|nr:kinase-like protein [Schizopora paradoxa]